MAWWAAEDAGVLAGVLAACVDEDQPPVSAAVDVDVVAPQPDASVPVDAGAVPHPAGSLTAGSSAGADAVSGAPEVLALQERRDVAAGWHDGHDLPAVA